MRIDLPNGVQCSILTISVLKRADSMEFNEKLQLLRKQNHLTQEQLAEALYVSRTAVSKWESGRGYPTIDSLKRIAAVFSITVDELLSGEEMITLAEQEKKQAQSRLRDLVFGLLDIGAAMLFFLPLFGEKADGMVQAVSLISLTAVASYVKVLYVTIVVVMNIAGIFTLALQNYRAQWWENSKCKLSFALTLMGVLLFVVTQQPYAAVLMLLFLIIKGLLVVRWQ